MRSRTAGFRAGLLIASAWISLGAAAQEQFVAPGDSGYIRIKMENLPASKYPVEGAKIEVAADPRFGVDAAGSTLGPVNIPPAATHNFAVHYTIASDAAEGSFPVVVAPTADTTGLVPGLDTAVTTLNFIVDSTLPEADVYDDQGLKITNSTTTRSSVVVRANDPAPGSGVFKFSISPGVYEDAVVAGGNAAGTEAPQAYSGLPDGSYAVTIEDNAGNQRTIAFKVDTVAPRIAFYDSRGLVAADGSTRGEEILIATDDRLGADGAPGAVVSGISRIELFAGPPIPANLLGSSDTAYDEHHAYFLSELGLASLPAGPITVRVADRAGNTASRSLLVDRVVPTITLANNEGVVIPSGGLTDSAFIAATCADDASGIDHIGIYNASGGRRTSPIFRTAARTRATSPASSTAPAIGRISLSGSATRPSRSSPSPRTNLTTTCSSITAPAFRPFPFPTPPPLSF